jgi:hypothetical protein
MGLRLSSCPSCNPTMIDSAGQIAIVGQHVQVKLAFLCLTSPSPTDPNRVSSDQFLSQRDCLGWLRPFVRVTGISIIPTKFPGSIQIVAMLSNGLIFVLKESLCTDPSSAPSSSASVNSLELDLAHSVQLSLDFRAKFRSIGFSAHPPPNNMPITKQNVMSVYGSCVLSSLQHVSGDHQQLHSVDQTSLSSGCIMSWLYE